MSELDTMRRRLERMESAWAVLADCCEELQLVEVSSAARYGCWPYDESAKSRRVYNALEVLSEVMEKEAKALAKRERMAAA